jgi:LPXTG-motif cell wall-anchored protein
LPKSYDVSFTVTQAEITGVQAIADVDAGYENEALANDAAVIAALPANVTAIYAGGTVSVPVTGWTSSPTYDPNSPGDYIYTANLDLTAIPANFLNSALVTAQAKVTVKAIDKTELADDVNDINGRIQLGPLVGLHEENYTAADWTRLTDAIAAAEACIANPLALQSEIDAKVSDIAAAVQHLKDIGHDHSILEHSHDADFGGDDALTEFGVDVSVRIKGDFRDVVEFKLNDKAYGLSAYVDEATPRTITEDGSPIGTIEKGSADVTLPAAFADRLANGTHTVAVTFKDELDVKAGVADIVVNRAAKTDGGTGSTGTPVAPASPKTGDESSLGLWLALGSAALIMLLGASYVLSSRRRRAAGRRKG